MTWKAKPTSKNCTPTHLGRQHGIKLLHATASLPSLTSLTLHIIMSANVEVEVNKFEQAFCRREYAGDKLIHSQNS